MAGGAGGWLPGFGVGGKEGGGTLCQLGRGALLRVGAGAGHSCVAGRADVGGSVGVVGGDRFALVVGRFAGGGGGGVLVDGEEAVEERGVLFGGRRGEGMRFLVGYMAESEAVEFPMLYVRLEAMKVGVVLH